MVRYERKCKEHDNPVGLRLKTLVRRCEYFKRPVSHFHYYLEAESMKGVSRKCEGELIYRGSRVVFTVPQIVIKTYKSERRKREGLSVPIIGNSYCIDIRYSGPPACSVVFHGG